MCLVPSSQAVQKQMIRMNRWTGNTEKQTVGSSADETGSLIYFFSCRHHSKVEFSEEIWGKQWSSFADTKGRIPTCVREEQGRKQKDVSFLYLIGKSNVGSTWPRWRQEASPHCWIGWGDCESKDQKIMFQWGEQEWKKG